MPRQARLVRPNATYHTSSRCADRKPLMKPDEMKELFLHCIRLTQKKYDFKLIQYTIMENHFHMLIRTHNDGDNISNIMQYLKSRYAQIYNKKTGRCGPFWNERFSSKIIEISDNPYLYFVRCTVYIGNNPVAALMVNDPRRYRYSSYNIYFDSAYKPDVHIDVHELYLALGKTFEERREVLLYYENLYYNSNR